jgi:hypothetical protein
MIIADIVDPKRWCMTLADLLPAIQDLPAADKLKLIRVLAEELDSGDDISPLAPHKVYYLSTPYGVLGAGRTLLQAMEHAGQESPAARHPAVAINS